MNALSAALELKALARRKREHVVSVRVKWYG